MKTVKKTIASRALIAAFVAVTLIAAQVVVLNHDLEPDGHAPDSVCEFCVASAGLASANVSDTKAPVLVSVSLRIPGAVHRVHTNAPLRYHFARAPPTVC